MENGKFDELFQEDKVLQQRLKTSRKNITDFQIERVFSRLMVQGKVNAAIRYLSDNVGGNVLCTAGSHLRFWCHY